jgi:hypothetical protein
LTSLASAQLIEASDERPLGAYAVLAASYASMFGGGLALALRRGHELPEGVDPRDLALYGVATHRLSRLLSREKVARFARAPFTDVDEGADTPPAELSERPRGGDGMYRDRRAAELHDVPRPVGRGRLRARPRLGAARDAARSVCSRDQVRRRRAAPDVRTRRAMSRPPT